VKARTIHAQKPEAGVPLTQAFHDHLLALKQSDARNPEVQNRYDRALAGDRRRPGPDLSFSGNEANPLFYYTGSEYVDIGTTTGLSRTEDGRGFVLVDLDGDGALDVVLHNYFHHPLVALLNRAGGAGNWLRIRLHGTTSNRFGIGARVTVNGRVQELACGSGYLSGNAPELHFGLGEAERADVAIRWPSGRREEYPRIGANRIHTFVEGDTSGHRVEELRREPIGEPVPEPAPPDPEVRTLLKELVTLGGQPARTEEPLMAVFFSTRCHACIQDLKRMEEWEARARGLGLHVAWVTVDPDPEEVEREFRLNQAPSPPLRAGRPLPELATPTVYFVAAGRTEKYIGQHALEAAFADASRLGK
jgi:hypothetical protein